MVLDEKLVEVYSAIPKEGIRYRELARKLHPMSNSTIVKKLRWLEFMGYIESKGVKSKRGRGVVYYNKVESTFMRELLLFPKLFNLMEKYLTPKAFKTWAVNSWLTLANGMLIDALWDHTNKKKDFDAVLDLIIVPFLRDLKNIDLDNDTAETLFKNYLKKAEEIAPNEKDVVLHPFESSFSSKERKT